MRQDTDLRPASPEGMARLLDDFATDGAATCVRCGMRMVDEGKCGECGRHTDDCPASPAALYQALVDNDLGAIARALMPKAVH